MNKLIKKSCMLTLLLVCMIFSMMSATVFATDEDTSSYEAKVIINKVSTGGTPIAEYYFDTVEEAFSNAATKEKEHNASGKGGVVTVTIQLLKDAEVTTTLVVNTNNSNTMIDFNGCSITSSADPVIQTGVMTFISNPTKTPCSITQKDVTIVSETAPNTIIYAPQGTMLVNVNAPELTIGDDTGVAIRSNAMLPSIQNGIFKGELHIAKPMFGVAITGGYFTQDPTPHIDTNAYEAVQNDEGLYYITTYHGAIVDLASDTIIQKYGLLQDAIDNVTSDYYVKVLKQGYPPKTVKIPSNGNLTLDLAGFQLTGAGSPTAAVQVDGTSLIQNDGHLAIVDSDTEDPGALNFVYDATFEDEAFTTIRNHGYLYLKDVSVSVNYNQPNYKGNIYTLFNDSSNSNAKIYIDANSRIGGLKLEPEDPATGKYPAFATKGNGNYENMVEVSYGTNDKVAYFVENCVVGEIMDVFDNDGNYTTTLSLRDGSDLQKENIAVKKDGVRIDFEYDSTTDVLTIPSSAFTDGADNIEISLQHKVTLIIDNEVFSIEMINRGLRFVLPEPPEKEGYTAKWSYDGSPITEDTVITLVYTPIPDGTIDGPVDDEPLIPPSTGGTPTENVETGDSFILWSALLLINFVIIFATYRHVFAKQK